MATSMAPSFARTLSATTLAVVLAVVSLQCPSSAAFTVSRRHGVGLAGRGDRTSLNLFELRPPTNGGNDNDAVYDANEGGAARSNAVGVERGEREWVIPLRAEMELSGCGTGAGGEGRTNNNNAAAVAARFPYRIELERLQQQRPSYREVNSTATTPSGAAAATRGSVAASASSAASSATATATATAAATRKFLTIRHLDIPDMDDAVKMCVDEFGSHPSSPSPFDSKQSDELFPGYAVVQPVQPDNLNWGKLFERRIVEPLLARMENWYFAWVVRSGLRSRIERRKTGDDGGAVPDHNVVCITEHSDKEKEEEILVGLAELSLQPPDPHRTAPPYVLPVPIKRLFSRYHAMGTPAADSAGDYDEKLLTAYVSNVLVRPDRRGLGYGRALMSALEGLARTWGHGSVSLHVDADSVSGREAQGLYRSMGYEGVPDDGRYIRGGKGESPYAWMGADFVQRGLYVVDGVPLLYLRKDLTRGR